MPEKHVPKHRAPKRGAFGRLSPGSRKPGRSSRPAAASAPARSEPVSDAPLAPKPPAEAASSRVSPPATAPEPAPKPAGVPVPQAAAGLFPPEPDHPPVRSSEEYFDSLVGSKPEARPAQPVLIRTSEPAEHLHSGSNGDTGERGSVEPGSTLVDDPDILRVKSAIKGGSQAWDPFLTDPEPEVRRFRRNGPVSDLDKLKTRPKKKPKKAKRPPAPPAEAHDGQHQTLGQWLREIVILGLIAVLTAVVLTNYVVQAFYIPSQSMESTLLINDRVLVNKLVYKLRDPRPGDIVVFADPERSRSEIPDRGPVGEVMNEAAQGLGLRSSVQDLIKRVVAVGGQTVEVRVGSLFVDGRQVDEPYRKDFLPMPSYGPFEVPEGQVFVMGDNRANSKDSRAFGPVAESAIVGRAFALIWPVQRFTWLG